MAQFKFIGSSARRPSSIPMTTKIAIIAAIEGGCTAKEATAQILGRVPLHTNSRVYGWKVSLNKALARGEYVNEAKAAGLKVIEVA